MTDEKFTLVETNRERANIARSARYTNRKGKGSVKIGVEYRTEKELQALNGEVKNYDLSKPMSFQEFKMMPEDLQGEYMHALYEKHGAHDMDIHRDLWKISIKTVTFYRRKFGILQPANKIRNGDWAKFISGEKEEIIPSTPIVWSDFKKLTADGQKTYVQQVFDKFGTVLGKDFAAMLGVTPSYFSRWIRGLGIEPPNHSNTTKTNPEFFEWAKSLIPAEKEEMGTDDGIPYSEQVEEAPCAQDEEDPAGSFLKSHKDVFKTAVTMMQNQISEEVNKTPESANEMVEEIVKEPSNGRMLKGSFTITGTVRDIYRMLEAMIGDEERTMNISIEPESFPDCLPTPIDPKTYGKVIDTMNNAQKQVMYGLIGKALDEGMTKGGKHA